MLSLASIGDTYVWLEFIIELATNNVIAVARCIYDHFRQTPTEVVSITFSGAFPGQEKLEKNYRNSLHVGSFVDFKLLSSPDRIREVAKQMIYDIQV